MQAERIPQVPSTKRMSKNGHTWTILTFAKVLRGPFTRLDISNISPLKYPPNSRNIANTLLQLTNMGLVRRIDNETYQITQEGIDTVYWMGGHFSRNTRGRSDLGD